MGKKEYIGILDKKDEERIKHIMINASNAIGNAYAAHIGGRDTKEFDLWFGATATAADRLTVRTVLHIMNYAMHNGRITIRYNTANCVLGVTNAVALAPPGGWGVATVAQAGRGAAIGDFEFHICPPMLHQMTITSADRQSQVGTAIHEISHLMGNTSDVVNPISRMIAYGADEAKSLALHNPNLAVDNAENYGFYASSFLK